MDIHPHVLVMIILLGVDIVFAMVGMTQTYLLRLKIDKYHLLLLDLEERINDMEVHTERIYTNGATRHSHIE